MQNFETLSLEVITQQVRDLTQDALLFQTKALVDKERELSAKTLVLFREIEKRQLHLEKGYASLFDLLVHYFGLSEGSASRRVASVRLMTQVPEIERKISDGELTLSTVAAAQRFFNAEAKNNHPLELDEKKELLAHRLSPGATLAEVIQALAEMGVEKIKKERFGVGSKPKSTDKERAKKTDPIVSKTEAFVSEEKADVCAEEFLGAENKTPDDPKSRSRHIPMAVRRTVYLRADGKCEYVDEATGQRCGSARFLELDHRVAFAKGGEHTVDSMMMACRNHNRLRAVKDFSAEWMAQFSSK